MLEDLLGFFIARGSFIAKLELLLSQRQYFRGAPH